MRVIQFDRDPSPDHAAAVREAFRKAVDDGGPLVLGPGVRVVDVDPVDFGVQDEVTPLSAKLDELAMWIAVEGVLLILLAVVVVALLAVRLFA